MRRSTAILLSLLCSVGASRAWADGGLRKGPWLMDLRRDSIVVMAERSRPGPLHVTARPLGPPGVADAAASELPPPVEVDDPTLTEPPRVASAPPRPVTSSTTPVVASATAATPNPIASPACWAFSWQSEAAP